MLTVQLLALFMVFVLLRSLLPIKISALSIVVSFFFALLFTVQLSSVVVTGEIADYRFYENFNLSDALSTADFFAWEGVQIFLALILSTFIIHFLGSNIARSKMHPAVKFSMVVAVMVILVLPGGIVNNLYTTLSLKFTKEVTFDKALASLNIPPADYTYKDRLNAVPGKNIVVLSLESLEKGYLGDKLAHLTPNLRRLSEENILFDMRQVPPAGWTSGSMYTAITGVPAFFRSHGNRVFQNSYENKITTLADILKAAGYDLEYFLGKKDYAGIDDMLTTLGFTVKSEEDFKTKYKKVDWGIQDMDLFEEFKKELLRKKASNTPFALFLSTISTHFPNGVPDKRIDSLLPPQRSRLELMVSATDHFIGELVAFLHRENMIDDTIFYIYPDHLLMGNRSQVIEDFDERSLYLLTNADSTDLSYPTDRPIFQIDIPKVIVEGAGIKTNAQFLTDFIPVPNKNAYLGENSKTLLQLNDAALKTVNCNEGMLVVRDSDSKTFKIRNNDGQVVFSSILPDKGSYQRILFYENFRPYEDFSVDASKKGPSPPKSFAYLDVFETNDLLYGSLKGKHQFGITKNGKKQIIFGKEDLDLLNGIALDTDQQNYIVIASHSWNAKKHSRFIIKGKEHKVQRGLTIVVLNSQSKYESRNFDTYASPEEAKAFAEVLLLLKKNDAPFIVLAHDSAAKHLKPHRMALKNAGFEFLATLKGRQAYIGHNLKGNLVEVVDDTTVLREPRYPKNFKDGKLYFDWPKYNFEPKRNRYIAHAGGEIEGVKYTNSLEALNANYAKGFRMFELDVRETEDGHFVTAHDWKHWAKETGYKGQVPVNLAEFKKYKFRGKFTPMDMKTLNEWFASHPDAILVTDKVNDPARFAKQFVDKKRLIMELFSIEAVKKAIEVNVTPLLSEKAMSQIKGNRIDFFKRNGIHHIGMSRRAIAGNEKALKEYKKNDIKVYVYYVNFDAGKDERYVLNNEIGLVYGMYADKWLPAFMPEPKAVSQN